MTRAECEAKIYRKMAEMVEIYRAYNPSGKSLVVRYDDGRFSADSYGEKPGVGFFKKKDKDYLFTSAPEEGRPERIGLDGGKYRGEW